MVENFFYTEGVPCSNRGRGTFMGLWHSGQLHWFCIPAFIVGSNPTSSNGEHCKSNELPHLTDFAELVQWLECFFDIEEVSGSIPLFSTKLF